MKMEGIKTHKRSTLVNSKAPAKDVYKKRSSLFTPPETLSMIKTRLSKQKAEPIKDNVNEE